MIFEFLSLNENLGNPYQFNSFPIYKVFSDEISGEINEAIFIIKSVNI